MLDKVVFFNLMRSGDIHVSRSLVRKVMELVPAKEYVYCHGNNEKLLKDIKNLQHSSDMGLLRPAVGWWFENNVLYCNTWYNAYDVKFNTGMTIIHLTDLFRYGLKETLDITLPEGTYFPKIDYNFFDVESINKFLVLSNKKKVLFCNNAPLSGQSTDFDMSSILDSLSYTFKDLVFIVSNRRYDKVERDNVFYFDDILEDECNLNEISYLSTKCDIIIGRCSGPFTYSQVEENFLSYDKLLISYTNLTGDYHFGLLDFEPPIKHCKLYNFTSEDSTILTEETIKVIEWVL